MQTHENTDRYLRLMDWARRRYTFDSDRPGFTRLITHTQGDKPSVYTRIEQAAWNRYMAAPTKARNAN